MEYTSRAAALTLDNWRTYLFATLFTAGNIALPQLCHLVPQGGLLFQPIYLFTVIAACRWGWRVALLTALVSPLLNTLWFGMPSVAMLPVVLLKSVVLALGVSWAMMSKVRKPLLVAVLFIIGAQLLGAVAEWALLSSATTLWLCLPGVVLQVVVASLTGRHNFRD
ncbi:MAG: ECF transporter S component [Prevotellamassilia sp.]|nr:ECF transporter S component [Prevotellamassilia sp.]